ncbi:cytochrome c oxidase, cbb3-type, CcoQ subunit [Campylobacter sp. VicNov18]|uniref:cytochrome c oxidase, cbb3-type, CcoQ subunit n=1 Tax=Campylobacter bilis TaxID=2691918 RepID=UPI00130D53E2|nr:cytochrome c oxidase, cbb3-type, CcoQ subunit [Campylobacter bilis]MPV63954.1 cytochrome c oxidase, cbb3-type, CcoQ subunit [Campylobacter hepaticus]MBM0637455.1 cytochrome c oxidase, cbb3-type, CcoQ subunit [Campylobacter bilis]MCC8278174.1 cytochrome c oxidase, cbb3-type, CcoQ subunit [Campylobacter bilis]MCC8299678.1 cytochrome c oxidase, cbb3-type, CcoQ subunit [Campylobacter bilis]MCC8301083.1 cytochrome c oxidase, cbb3-type, CcoQ subunit [Campylobacter bilis]
MENLSIVFEVVKNLITLNLAKVQRHEWEIFQGYGFFALVVFLSLGLYCYWYHLYRSEKKGERNYEKYADLVLKDDIDDSVLESKRSA